MTVALNSKQNTMANIFDEDNIVHTAENYLESLRDIGLWLAERRLEMGLSRKDLAKELQVSVTTIMNAENATSTYSMKFFLLWCAALDVTPTLITSQDDLTYLPIIPL